MDELHQRVAELEHQLAETQRYCESLMVRIHALEKFKDEHKAHHAMVESVRTEIGFVADREARQQREAEQHRNRRPDGTPEKSDDGRPFILFEQLGNVWMPSPPRAGDPAYEDGERKYTVYFTGKHQTAVLELYPPPEGKMPWHPDA